MRFFTNICVSEITALVIFSFSSSLDVTTEEYPSPDGADAADFVVCHSAMSCLYSVCTMMFLTLFLLVVTAMFALRKYQRDQRRQRRQQRRDQATATVLDLLLQPSASAPPPPPQSRVRGRCIAAYAATDSIPSSPIFSNEDAWVPTYVDGLYVAAPVDPDDYHHEASDEASSDVTSSSLSAGNCVSDATSRDIADGYNIESSDTDESPRQETVVRHYVYGNGPIPTACWTTTQPVRTTESSTSTSTLPVPVHVRPPSYETVVNEPAPPPPPPPPPSATTAAAAGESTARLYVQVAMDQSQVSPLPQHDDAEQHLDDPDDSRSSSSSPPSRADTPPPPYSTLEYSRRSSATEDDDSGHMTNFLIDVIPLD